MTVYEAVWALIRDALFQEKIDYSEHYQDIEFWTSVYAELQSQLAIGLTSIVASKHEEIPSDIRQRWINEQREYVGNYYHMLAVEQEACALLHEADIPVAVMKGTAAAIYYPVPEHRVMRDVDLIVKPDDYERAIDVLMKNGYEKKSPQAGRYHTELDRCHTIIELHQSPNHVHMDEHGNQIRKYILSGIDNIEINQTGGDEFPILPWKQNGMELLWHIRQHLYNGLGLRHILDWMMFVNRNLDDACYKQYSVDLDRCGLKALAIHVTRMCQLYLGLQDKTITWCKTADERLCDELMSYIIDQGDFGIKKNYSDKTTKVLSGYTNIGLLIERLQEIGRKEWNITNRIFFLRPLAWIYAGIRIMKKTVNKKGGIAKLLKDIRLSRKRQKLFKKLYTVPSNKEKIVGLAKSKIKETKKCL